jgi:zinc protease
MSGFQIASAWMGLIMTLASGGADPTFQQVRNASLPNGLPVTQYKLSNGLQLYVVENHSSPVFTFQTWFDVGSAQEKLDPRLQRTGLAHLFEHMMFRGTLNHGDGEFDRILTINGVDDENATTWLDRTNYYESLPSDRLELVMQLESDRMANLVVDQNLLDTERGAVLGEYRMGLDDPDSVAYDKLYGTAFIKHPYHYTTIGTEQEINSFTASEAQYFYRTYYAPNNAVILIAGDIKPSDAVTLAAQYYGSLPSQPIPTAQAPAEPAQTIERTVEFTHAQLVEPKLLLGYHTPEARHPDQAALMVAESLLAEGEGALLRDTWVNAGLASTLYGSVNQLKDPGLFILGADLQESHTPLELLGALDRVLGQAAQSVTAPQLDRAKNQLLLSMYRQWENNGDLTSFMGEFIASAGDPLYAFDLASAVDHVTVADVQRVIGKYLTAANRTVVIGHPQTAGDGP